MKMGGARVLIGTVCVLLACIAQLIQAGIEDPACTNIYHFPQGADNVIVNVTSVIVYGRFDFTCLFFPFGTRASQAYAMQFNPPVTASYTVRITNCGPASNDPLVQIATGANCSSPPIFCDDDTAHVSDQSCAGTSDAGIPMTAGENYFIFVTNFDQTTYHDPDLLPTTTLEIKRVIDFVDNTANSTELDGPFPPTIPQLIAEYMTGVLVGTLSVLAFGMLCLLLLYAICARRPTKVGDDSTMGAKVGKARALIFGIFFAELVICISTWGVVWSVLAYLFGMAISVIAFFMLLALREPSSVSAMAQLRVIRHFRGLQVLLFILTGLLFLNVVVGLAQTVLLLKNGCGPDADGFTCKVANTQGIYGVVSVGAALVMVGLTLALAPKFSAIVDSVNRQNANMLEGITEKVASQAPQTKV